MKWILKISISTVACLALAADAAEKKAVINIGDCDLDLNGGATIRVDVPLLRGASMFIAAFVENNSVGKFHQLNGIEEDDARKVILKDIESMRLKGDYLYIRAKYVGREKTSILYIRDGFVQVPVKTSDGKEFDLRVPRERFKIVEADDKKK